jgi:hypothetical protein
MEVSRSMKSRTLHPVCSSLALIVGAILAETLPAAVSAQTVDEMTRARAHVQAAVEARNEGDYQSYLRELREALGLRPGHPELVYYVAGAHALLGRPDEAVAALVELADLGLGFPAEADPAFESLVGDPAFEAVLRRLRANRQPVGHAELAFRIPEEPDFIPEGIAHDPVEGAFYLGSVRKRKIIKIMGDGSVEEFASPGEAGMWSVMGMAVDPVRRHLWVCTAALPETEGVRPEEAGRSAVFKFDLATGEILLRFHFSAASRPRTLGDLAVGSDGAVYVSDSQGAIYRIRPEGTYLEVLVQRNQLASPQGLALSEDGRRLYVADYPRGVFYVDLDSREVRPLEVPDDQTLLGIDGLARRGSTLIAVQNGAIPNRILRLRLGRGGREVRQVEILAASHPQWDEPTLGVVVGDRFYFVANSQWSRFADGLLPPSEQLSDPAVMWLRLNHP